ncbi:hypothetical protein KI387_020005 [Taxus chinensis]|uniref:TPX2 C-terminal domain-containing protein n=1 Tax=Taxus chinensis TaxID=29808 RepID=A0AA38G7B1_TAXCH|nr:hypothetical protein KI387_020005 [Taxus chinensis]
MITGEDESHKMEKDISLHGIDCIENGLSSDDQVSQLSFNIGNLGKENLVYDVNKEEDATTAEMLEESYEYKETAKEVKETTAAEASSHEHVEVRDEGQVKSEVISKESFESKLKKENNSVLDKQNRMPSYQRLTQSRSLKTGANLPGKSGNTSPQIQNSMLPKSVVTKTKNALQSGKDANKGNRAEAENVEVLSAASKNPLHKKISLGSTRQNHTIPKPFSQDTNKRVSFGMQRTSSEVAQNNYRRASTSIATSSVAVRKQLAAKSASGVSETKMSHSIVHKPPTSTEASNGRISIVAAAAGTISVCKERVQKRKEFNTKVEEKPYAKEEEKKQLQAKPKGQQGDQLKKLRRSLSFKSNPVPDFHHEAAPPKLESKKIPACAKSPQLVHRKSSIGVEPEENSSEHKAKRIHRSSTCKIPSKGNSAVKKPMENVLTKAPKTFTRRKSNSREPITPKQEALDVSETGYSRALTKNENNGTSVLLHGSESPINEDGVKQNNKVESLNTQSIILESNRETELSAGSENLIAIAETAALIENLQVSHGSN